MTRLMVFLVLVLALGLSVIGCGSSGSGSSHAFEQEVRGAMAMSGNAIFAREALEKARADRAKAGTFLAAGEAGKAEAVIREMEAATREAQVLNKKLDFKRYAKRAFTTAMKRIETNGLVGEGCHFHHGRGWQC